MNDGDTVRPTSLFARAAAGDPQARDQLLVDNLPQLEAYLRLQAGAALRRKESLSDLAQSVCLQVLRDLPEFEFRSEAQFRHWLCKHALHKLINKREYYGAEKRDMAREVAMAAASSSGGSVLQCYATLCTPSRHASDREAIERFEAVFDELPEDYRQAITLKRIVGLEYAEIAATMGRTEGAVRNLVYRGLARLSGAVMPRDDES
ncbi:MAG TPA: sigma-70 family RNA polymerase sigma factor [Planctomycetota bacterium]|nr:sigma-70 family RNA polymerase sigma factor [Planctomycetota bacterium]